MLSSTAPRRKRVSQSLQGYQVGKTISKSNGKVKKAVHLATGQTVIIKAFSFRGIIGDARLAKVKILVQREMFLAANLKHTHILTCYDTIMGKKHAYIVMEWMKSGSLLDYVRERGGRLPECEARRYFRQLIHAITCCHANMVVHRDIKPANLLLDSTKKRLKLIDFGLSNIPDENLKLKTHAGTNGYQAPEIDKDNTRYDAFEVDIYSSGVTLYHLLFGPPTIINQQLGEFFVPSDVGANEAVKNLILEMTKRVPEDRLTISQIKNHHWFLDGGDEFLEDPGPGIEQQIDHDLALETVQLTGCKRDDLIRNLIQGECTKDSATYKILQKMRVERLEA